MVLKFADDTAVVGLITGDEQEYRQEIDYLVDWADKNFIQLNASKTKELRIDFRRKKDPLLPIAIKGSNIECVDSFKYLGVTFSADMTWSVHVDTAVNKSKQRLHLLRKLRQFNVSEPVLSLYYRSTIESLITYCLLTSHSNMRKKDMKRTTQILNQARKIIGKKQKSRRTLH